MMKFPGAKSDARCRQGTDARSLSVDQQPEQPGWERNVLGGRKPARFRKKTPAAEAGVDVSISIILRPADVADAKVKGPD